MNKETKKLEIYQDPKTRLWGLKDEAGNIIKKPFAYYIYYDGTFQRERDGLYGLVDMKTGYILTEPFASCIYSDGRFKRERDGLYGLVDWKTGKIIKDVR